MTARTIEYTNIKRHLLPVSTAAACLTRIGRVDFHKLSTSFFRFAGQFIEKLRPRGVYNAFCQTMIMGHSIDVQVFYRNDAKSINNLAAFLMSEIISTEFDTFVDTGNGLTVFPSLRRPFRQLGMLALYLSQGLLFLAEETGIGDFFTSGERSEGFQANVNPDLCSNGVKSFRLTLDRKGDIPLACRRALHGTGFDFALDRAVIDHLDTADLGKGHALIRSDAKPRLGEAERIIASEAFKTGIAGFLGMFSHATEARLHSEINAH